MNVDSPAVKIVDKYLRDAVGHDATRIRFERQSKNQLVFETVLEDGVPRTRISQRPGPWGPKDIFYVFFEIDGEYETVGCLPIVLWEQVISRLKVISRMVDYGPAKSVNGRFSVIVDDDRVENFLVTSNPNPFADRIITVERERLESC